MLILEGQYNINADDLLKMMTNLAQCKINKNYIYELLEKECNKVILYSFETKIVQIDLTNCPCSLIYNTEYKNDTFNIYIMFIATKHKFRGLGYASLFLKEFIDFVQLKYKKIYNKTNIVLDSLENSVTFYENLGFKYIITDEYNHVFDIKDDDVYEHFILIYEI
jgi:GNAT superfamily N-acetyltransferase